MILSLCLLWESLVSVEHAVTYEFSGGRFGDNLLAYLHAKWLCYMYDLPLLYKSFKHSSDLILHEKEKEIKLSEYRLRYRAGIENIAEDLHHTHPLLFICPYFPEDRFEREREQMNYPSWFEVDWKDEGFRKMALEMIAPRKSLRLIEPPDDSINIAFHVRIGEGYDADDMRLRFPLKLPPFEFYVDAFQQVLGYFNGKKVYCHIFTDALTPARLVETFKGFVPQGVSVKFGFRKGWSWLDGNVLDDFFSLFLFDVLIRSQSNFSLIPSRLHDFALVCFPSAYSIEEGRVKIEKMEIEINEPLLKKVIDGF